MYIYILNVQRTPADQEWRKLWDMSLAYHKCSTGNLVCMLHFIENVDYTQKRNKLFLTKYAVPSIFSHESHSEVEEDTGQIETSENVAENECQNENEDRQIVDSLRKEIESLKENKTRLKRLITRQSKELEDMRNRIDDDFVTFALNKHQDDRQV